MVRSDASTQRLNHNETMKCIYRCAVHAEYALYVAYREKKNYRKASQRQKKSVVAISQLYDHPSLFFFSFLVCILGLAPAKP